VERGQSGEVGSVTTGGNVPRGASTAKSGTGGSVATGGSVPRGASTARSGSMEKGGCDSGSVEKGGSEQVWRGVDEWKRVEVCKCDEVWNSGEGRK